MDKQFGFWILRSITRGVLRLQSWSATRHTNSFTSLASCCLSFRWGDSASRPQMTVSAFPAAGESSSAWHMEQRAYQPRRRLWAVSKIEHQPWGCLAVVGMGQSWYLGVSRGYAFRHQKERNAYEVIVAWSPDPWGCGCLSRDL